MINGKELLNEENIGLSVVAVTRDYEVYFCTIGTKQEGIGSHIPSLFPHGEFPSTLNIEKVMTIEANEDVLLFHAKRRLDASKGVGGISAVYGVETGGGQYALGLALPGQYVQDLVLTYEAFCGGKQ
jgi:hypothetical protein